MYKRLTDKSYLKGSVIQTSFIPLQMVCEIGGKKKVLYSNVLCSASDSARPYRTWAVQETTGWCKKFLFLNDSNL